MVTGVVPHVGGPIIGPGAVTVVASNMVTSVVGDQITCVGPPDAVAPPGAVTVMATNKPITILGNPTTHGGSIVGPGAVT